MIEEQTGAILLKMALWGEVRGERDAGGDLDGVAMLAVGHVILNRSKFYKNSIAAVILGRKQFSSFNADDPNRAKLLTAWRDDPTSWERADAIVDVLLAGLTKDPTFGALNYYNPKTADPAWGRRSKTWEEHAEIDHQVFGIAGARIA
jgi:spore germination cell wall hydrolase CwlJ-like protein